MFLINQYKNMQVEIKERQQQKVTIQIDSPTLTGQENNIQCSDFNIQDSSTCESTQQTSEKLKNFEISIPYQNNADGLRASTLIQCPYCKYISKTKIQYQAGNKLYISMILLCLTLPIIVWLPIFTEKCYSVVSYCSECNRQVGISN
ncbi:hypothetical protein pb186bvf_016425 [Paramecium bursaria]